MIARVHVELLCGGDRDLRGELRTLADLDQRVMTPHLHVFRHVAAGLARNHTGVWSTGCRKTRAHEPVRRKIGDVIGHGGYEEKVAGRGRSRKPPPASPRVRPRKSRGRFLIDYFLPALFRRRLFGGNRPLPAFRASESPMAMACLRARDLVSASGRSSAFRASPHAWARSTFLPAMGPYFA